MNNPTNDDNTLVKHGGNAGDKNSEHKGDSNGDDNSNMRRARRDVVRLRAGLRTTTLSQVGQVRCVASISQ